MYLSIWQHVLTCKSQWLVYTYVHTCGSLSRCWIYLPLVSVLSVQSDERYVWNDGLDHERYTWNRRVGSRLKVATSNFPKWWRVEWRLPRCCVDASGLMIVAIITSLSLHSLMMIGRLLVIIAIALLGQWVWPLQNRRILFNRHIFALPPRVLGCMCLSTRVYSNWVFYNNLVPYPYSHMYLSERQSWIHFLFTVIVMCSSTLFCSWFPYCQQDHGSIP